MRGSTRSGSGDSLTAKPRLEPLSVLSAVAARTQRVRLGTAVLLGALRHPVLLAHAAATDRPDLGGPAGPGASALAGRSTMLSGRSGGTPESTPPAEPHVSRKWCSCIKRLTSGETVTFDGRHFSMQDVSIAPVSPNTGGVRVLVACHWRAGRDRQFRRAAELGDGYISISDYPDEYRER